MAEYEVKLKKREEVAAATMAFWFDRPKGFDFVAGQHITVNLINPPETDEKGDARAFCLANAPYEKNLMIAMRMRDTAFKRVLKTLPLGGEVRMSSARGSFILHDDFARPAVFLAGGIGITPVRSMLFQAARDNLEHKLFLFYSNRRPKEAAFLDELKSLQDQNANYKLIPVMSYTEGYINTAKLKRHLNNLNMPVYYVVGPPEFVLGMRAMLNQAGIAESDIKTDQFAGY